MSPKNENSKGIDRPPETVREMRLREALTKSLRANQEAVSKLEGDARAIAEDLEQGIENDERPIWWCRKCGERGLTRQGSWNCEASHPELPLRRDLDGMPAELRGRRWG